METGQYQRRLGTIARHLTNSSSLHALAYEKGGSTHRKGGPVIIGGMVLDIQATPTGGRLVRGSTTPGQILAERDLVLCERQLKVQYVRGGVARNVAESMALLGTSPFLISVVGEDVAGESMVSHWKSLGLSVDGIRRCKGATTPVVSAVFDKQGELASAVADTYAIEEHLTSEWINSFADMVKGAPILMLDANLLPAAIETACNLAKEANVPIWFEPVSVTKSVRGTDFLHLMTYTSPNEAELIAMADAFSQEDSRNNATKNDVQRLEELSEPAASIWQMQHSIQRLLETGLKYIVLTMGGHGAVLCSYRETQACTEAGPQVTYFQFPALPASIVNLSGAGDCLVAGTLVALSASTDISVALAYGVSSSKWAVESDSNVSSGLSLALVSDGAKKVSSSARQIMF